MKRLFVFLLLLTLSLFAVVPHVFAQSVDWSSTGCIVNGANGEVATLGCIPVLISNIFKWIFIFIGIIALFFIIFGGIKFILSGGDAKQAEAARNTIMFAIIGLIIVLLSYAIINFIAYVTHVDCIADFGLNNLFNKCN